MTQKDLRVGSVIRNLIGDELIVAGFNGLFTIAKFDLEESGEIWLVDSHMNGYELVRY